MARPDDDEFIDVSEEIAEGEEGKGYGRADGPDSQGERAGEGFGRNAQGASGDEDFDPSYQREHDEGTLGTPPIGEPLSSAPLSPAEHVGPGRGEHGSEFTAQAGAGSEPEAGAPSAAGNALVSVDAALRELVTERLVEQLDIDPGELQVEVDDGVVALTGDVDDPAVPARAEQIAAAVSGVHSVSNQIRVRRGEDED
jgi:hypothetical protein